MSGSLQVLTTEGNMGLFGKKELTWEEVIEFLNEHQHEIVDTLAAELVLIIIKSKSNKLMTYRVADDND